MEPCVGILLLQALHPRQIIFDRNHPRRLRYAAIELHHDRHLFRVQILA
jgi:hypothetical protein